MAVSNSSVEDLGHAKLYTWASMPSGNTGRPMLESAYGDRTVQFVGTFDSGTVILEGSNDGANWKTLTDPQGNAISFTSAGMEQVMETPRYTRPSISGGGGSCSITTIIHARRTMK